jgi:hypothetical protein
LNCRICGDALDPRRVELGYDYCLKEECQRLCLKGVKLASVGVNKAADYYMSAKEVAGPQLPPPTSSETSEPEQSDPTAAGDEPLPRPAVGDRRRPTTTLERLRALESKLDRDLKRSFERFERGEITSGEMERECDRLIASFNQIVMAENIRFRSMLRPRRSRTR